MGRRKINIAKIEDRQKRHVSFSKRRMGLFKKASELSTLCDAEVAIVVFSASGKPYICSGPSSAETVFHRYLATDDSSSSASEPQSSDSAISNLVLLSNLATQIEDDEGHVVPEKRTQVVETGKGKGINVEAIDDFDELEQLQKFLNKKREKLLAQAKQSLDEPSASEADSGEFDIDDEEMIERSAVPLLPWSYQDPV